MNKKIVVYGTGKAGKAIVRLLNKNYSVFGISRNTINKKSILRSADWVILTASEDIEDLRRIKGKTGYELRVMELKRNLYCINEFIKNMHGLRAKIIVLTNPSDLFARYIKNVLGKKEVYSFGLSLDKNRISSFLGKKIEVVGYHGLAMPVLGWDSKKDYYKIMSKVDKKAVKNFQANGIDYNLLAKEFEIYFAGLNQIRDNLHLNDIEKKILNSINKRFDADYSKNFGLGAI